MDNVTANAAKELYLYARSNGDTDQACATLRSEYPELKEWFDFCDYVDGLAADAGLALYLDEVERGYAVYEQGKGSIADDYYE